jgi:hypothetical protein
LLNKINSGGQDKISSMKSSDSLFLNIKINQLFKIGVNISLSLSNRNRLHRREKIVSGENDS